jgi:hypothetical protein
VKFGQLLLHVSSAGGGRASSSEQQSAQSNMAAVKGGSPSLEAAAHAMVTALFIDEDARIQ